MDVNLTGKLRGDCHPNSLIIGHKVLTAAPASGLCEQGKGGALSIAPLLIFFLRSLSSLSCCGCLFNAYLKDEVLPLLFPNDYFSKSRIKRIGLEVWLRGIQILNDGRARWLMGKRSFSTRMKTWFPILRADVKRQAGLSVPIALALAAGNRRSTGACRLPDSLQVQWETLR